MFSNFTAKFKFVRNLSFVKTLGTVTRLLIIRNNFLTNNIF